MPHVDHQAHGDDRGDEQGGGGEAKRHERQRVVGLPQQDGRDHAGRGNDHADARPDVAGRRRPGEQAGGEVGGERGQLGTGPRGGRLGRSRVVFILGQPALRQRHLEGANHLFAVDGGDGQAVTAPGACCYLVSRLSHHQRLP